MKKRRKGLCILLAIMLLVSGCGKETKKEEATLINSAPLNIIDDNYRNYYEVFVYSFCDGDGDGIGDFKGLTSKLDYINDGDDKTDSDMGFNGIWLMPIMQSTTYHKYDVVDYYNIDKEYGTRDDFKAFMVECEKRNIKVILDLVMNHTSSQHEWFIEATEYIKSLKEGQEPSAKENKYFGYYNFTKEPQGTKYYQVGNTEWYYEAGFVSEMPDLNLGNQEVRKEFEEIVKYWMDLGVGGFRLDAAKEYYSDNTEKNNEVLAWLNHTVKAIDKDAYIVAEVWTPFNTYSQYYKSGIDSVFDFAFADANGKIVKTLNYTGSDNSGKALGQSFITLQEKLSELNPNYIDAPFFTNHDLARAAGYFSGDNQTEKTKMAGAINLMMNGSAFVYYGEELGMNGSGIDENKRAPMRWSKEETKEGMCRGPVAMERIEQEYDSLEEQQKDDNSIYNFYKQAVKLRNQNPEIARGLVTYIDEVTDEDICAITKEYNGSKIHILMNVSAEAKSVSLSKETYSYNELRGALKTGKDNVLLKGETVKLPPYSVAILK